MTKKSIFSFLYYYIFYMFFILKAQPIAYHFELPGRGIAVTYQVPVVLARSAEATSSEGKIERLQYLYDDLPLRCGLVLYE